MAKNFYRFKPLLRLVAVAAALTGLPVSAQAPLDIRVALIIGNSAYANAPLVNPANDARAMAEVLRSLGFQVIELRDGNKAQMAAAISKVSDSLKGKQGVGMLYYAGHGLQLDWRNYMVPVDANLKNAADVSRQTIDLSSVIDLFKSAGNRMNIVVLDACRDNPFGGSTSSAKGLAQLDAPPSTFLAYATAPGNVAEDGDEKSGNGLYTQFLLQELKRPTAKIEDVFKRVRLNVRKQSQGRQIPWESTSLEDDFYFNDGVKFTIKPEELERIAAEGRQREQKRLAQEAQIREREQQLALALTKERERQQAEIRELEQQRIAAEARAKEQERLAAEARVKEQERLAAEARTLEQQRVATEARVKEAERLSADARVKEQQRLLAEARALEEQRLALEAQARERARAVALEQTRERERQLAEAKSRDQQRQAIEAQARERERVLALGQAKERERLLAESKAREQERLAEAEQLRDAARVALLARAPEQKMSKEQLKEMAFKESSAAWEIIKTSSNADDFYAFLQRFPSGGELAEMAQYRLDQLAKPRIAAALGQGQDASLGYNGARLKLGDTFEVQISDILTNVPGERRVNRVTSIDGDTVVFNNGSGIFTVLGAVIKNGRGSYDPPFGGTPVEFQIGKKWSGRSTQKGNDGKTYQLQQDTKIVGRETITVPAGTFQTYVFETTVYVGGGPTITTKRWVDPRYGVAIKSEELGRIGGRIVRSDRQEMVAIKADRG